MTSVSAILVKPTDWTKLAIAVICFWGAFYSWTVPLFESPDEAAHFARAYGIAEGQMILKDSPRHLVLFMYDQYRNENRRQILPILDGLLIEFPDRVRFIAPNTAMYSPVPYIFHAIGIWIVTAFGETDFLLTVSVYFCRMISLMLFSSILYLISRLSRIVFWPVFWIAATPMALSQSAMVNLDFLILGTCLILLSASVSKLNFSSFTFLASLSAFFLLLTKPPYIPILLVPAISAVYVRRAGAMQIAGFFTGVLLIPILGASIWNGLMVSFGMMNDFSVLFQKYANAHVDPVAQLIYMKTCPLQFFQIIGTTLYSEGIMYLHQFTGILGWQDLPVPFWTVVLWTVFSIPAIGINEKTDISFRYRVVLGTTCIITAVLILVSVFVSAYLVWTPVGANAITVQGRYFHTAAAAGFVGLAFLFNSDFNPKLRHLNQMTLAATACLINATAIVAVIQKYGLSIL